jgi:gluconolactonase
VTRTEKDGKLTVLADSFEGKRLNAPNDIVVKSDDSIWFTDPLFGINGEWEGARAKPEQATTNVYRIAPTASRRRDHRPREPNGLAFSPDEKKLYVVEWKGTPNRSIWSYDVGADGSVSNKAKLIDAADQGALDGFRSTATATSGAAGAATARSHAEPTDVAAARSTSFAASPRISTA